VSSTKQFVPGASAKRCVRSDPQAAQGGKRRERSNPGAARKVKCRARSNSRPVRGARRRARRNPAQTPRQKVSNLDRSERSGQSARTKTGAAQGGKRRERSNPGTARKAKYRARSNPRMVRSAEVLSTAYAAGNAGTRCQPRSNPCIASGASVEQGAIPDRCKVQMVGTSNSGRKKL
jgi:hypothetical protein